MANLDTARLEIAKYNMIEQQIRPCEVNDPRVIEALHMVNRHEFVPEMYQNLAYADCQIPFTDSQTMMKPLVEGKILQALKIEDNESCLEIGTGTGYFTACLAMLAKEVHSMDIDKDIISKAQALLSDNYKNITLETGDAFVRLGPGRKFDVIAVTSAVSEIPDNFKDALNDGGRLFIIQGGGTAIMSAKLITRISFNEWTTTTLFETEINQLIN